MNNFNSPHLDDEITPEEELEISGYRPEQVALIDQEYLIQRDSEQAEPIDSSENPLVRGAIASLLVGGVMGFGWMCWSIFFAPKQIAKNPATPKPTQQVLAQTQSQEEARLKAELALRNQESSREKQPQKPIPQKPTPSKSSPTVQKSAPVVRTRIASLPPPRIIRSQVPSPPRIIRETAPSQQPRNLPVSKPTQAVDPFKQWSELATLGQQTVALNDKQIQQTETVANRIEQTNTSNSTAINSSSPVYREVSFENNSVISKSNINKPSSIPTVAVNSGVTQTETNTSQIQTPGEWGIINRQIPNTQYSDFIQTASTTPSNLQVQIGTTAQAKVLVPMVWAKEDKNQGRFAVELEEDVLSNYGRVALPKGTILITEVDSVSEANKLVKQSVVAIVYTDSFGKVQQQTIPRDAILIRGSDNKPLIAQSLQDRGAAIAQQDILIGLLGAAGRAGQVFNQNQTQSQTVVSNGGFNQTIVTGARKPNLLAAAVEGFFQPMQQRLSKRADKTDSELQNRPNVAIVPAGTKVSIFFNSFFEITR
jgi:Bacterial conjugation TrbI-like protein